MITCMSCDKKLADMRTREETIARGRFLGWRIFDGKSAAGTEHHAVYCPGCVDVHRPRAPKPPAVMDDQLLFDI